MPYTKSETIQVRISSILYRTGKRRFFAQHYFFFVLAIKSYFLRIAFFLILQRQFLNRGFRIDILPHFSGKNVIYRNIFFRVDSDGESIDVILLKIFWYFDDPVGFPHFFWMQKNVPPIPSNNFYFFGSRQIQSSSSIIIGIISDYALDQIVTSEAN